jgi:hypothetical protein
MHANIISACADSGIKSLLSDKSYLKDVSYVVLPVGIAADEEVVFSTCASDARWVPGHVKCGEGLARPPPFKELEQQGIKLMCCLHWHKHHSGCVG